MKKHYSNIELLFILTQGILIIIIGLLTATMGLSLSSFTRAATEWYAPTQKQGTFDFSTAQPTPTSSPTTSSTTYTGLPRGGENGVDYCIDDEDPDGCDDNTAFLVPKGTGGTTGSCGTVIEQTHKLVANLSHALKGMRDSLNAPVSNCGYTASAVSSPSYVSTLFVIDAFRLAGFTELDRNNANQVKGTELLSWWQGQPAGYKFIPYSPTLLQQHANGTQNLTGCVMFLNLSGGVHVGIVNVLQLTDAQAGNGVISILQSGARFYLDRFEVVGWDIKNTPLHQTQLQSVTGFGCKQ